MSKTKAVLFDVDGVVAIAGVPFSVRYATEQGFDPSVLKPFFSGVFQQALVGKADLKDLLENNRDMWRWNGSIDDLMLRWLGSGDTPNAELIELIAKIRGQGLSCYLATNQDKYRTAFIREVMFPEVFDDIFSSAEIGFTKPSKEFFDSILKKLATCNIKASEIAYFDDERKNIDAALSLGIRSYLYANVSDVSDVLGPRAS
jgi:putative hydrolase of the HAD superfamily